MNYEAVGKDVLEIVSDNVFVRMSDTQTPQGIMAVVKMSEITIEDMFGRDMHINSMNGKNDVNNNTDSNNAASKDDNSKMITAVIPAIQYSHFFLYLKIFRTPAILELL